MREVRETNISALPLLSRGKVRDIYGLDDDRLLIVTTDRMSAFDVILPRSVPYKGVVLNQLTLFWMKKFEGIVPNHILESDAAAFPEELSPWRDELEGRAVIVRKAKPLPAECIVRGYISGSGWESYKKNGEICGIRLAPGLAESQKLDAPIFTPTTKESMGGHDRPVSFAELGDMLGPETAERARDLSLSLYEAAAEYAREKGIIIADTKFEFGLIDGGIHLIDEALTPDSSRFWPAASYAPGHAQPSFDKQYLRDWLKGSGWKGGSPAASIPDEVIEATGKKYQEAYERLVK